MVMAERKRAQKVCLMVINLNWYFVLARVMMSMNDDYIVFADDGILMKG